MGPLTSVVILVVEDDPDARELMQAALEQRGAVVHAADCVHRAFDILERVTPDVIVSDIAMPEEDGVAFVRRLRESGVTTPAVAVSAYVAPADLQRALTAGFDRYLHKPVEFDQLVTEILELHGIPAATG